VGVRFFGLTELGRKLFGFEKAVDGRRAHWMKLPLDWFSDPVVVTLNGTQQLVLLGLAMLCLKRNNSVPFSPKSVRLALNLSRNPDLAFYVDQGFIELDSASRASDPMRGEEREEKRGEERDVPAYVPPPDVRAEASIRQTTATLERTLYARVAVLSDRTNQDTLTLMREVTAYKKPDGVIVPGRSNPSGMTSERLERSIADADAWIADLDKKAATA
jgi:hypothetical protein